MQTEGARRKGTLLFHATKSWCSQRVGAHRAEVHEVGRPLTVHPQSRKARPGICCRVLVFVVCSVC